MALPGTFVGVRSPAPRRAGDVPPNLSNLPANTRAPTVLGKGAGAYGISREVAALVLWTLALFVALALASYRGDPSGGALPAVPSAPGADWVGAVGSFAAHSLVSMVGLVAWALPVEMALIGIPLVRGRESPATPGRC